MLRPPLVIAVIALALVACPKPEDKETATEGASGASETSGSHANGETDSGTPAPPPERPESIPLLCTIDAGKWCTSVCPPGLAGPLCCSGSTCVPWDVAGPACDGDTGWCNNYSLSKDLATCHDG